MSAPVKYLPAPALKHDAMMLARFQSKLDARMHNERRIVWNLIRLVLAAGYVLHGIHDGDDYTKVKTAPETMELAFNLDDVKVYFTKGDGKPHTWMRFIFGNGNDGKDVLCDYGTDLEPVIGSFDFDACVAALMPPPEWIEAVREAHRLLDSVAFLQTEGDKDVTVAKLAALLEGY